MTDDCGSANGEVTSWGYFALPNSARAPGRPTARAPFGGATPLKGTNRLRPTETSLESAHRLRPTDTSLAIARELIEAHGATIMGDSDHSPGARFVVRLPLNR